MRAFKAIRSLRGSASVKFVVLLWLSSAKVLSGLLGG